MNNPAFRNRISERFACQIDVVAATTLENRPARIVDLSTHGAKVEIEQPYAVGDRIHLDYRGDFVWAVVAWAEVDRMGLRFIMPLQRGHGLNDRLEEMRRHIRSPIVQAARPSFGRRAA